MARAPAENEEWREDHVDDDRRGSHHHAGLEVADGAQGGAHGHEPELQRHGRDEPGEVLCRQLGGARVGGHAAGVGEARGQADHEEQGARHHGQHLRLVEEHYGCGRVLPAHGVRDHGGGADAEHLREGEHDEGEVAGDADGGDGGGAKATHPVEVDQEVEGLKQHGHEHEARGFQQVAGDGAGGEVLHGDRRCRERCRGATRKRALTL